ELWLPGAITEWDTGKPTGQPIKDKGKHTHCSQFAAAACDRLGIYLLHPPEHRATFLASAQQDWLLSKGIGSGGLNAVADGKGAQELANRGNIVVAVFKSEDPKRPGHIAVIRPSTKSDEEIQSEGPQITQAGGENHNSCSLKEGFHHHPGAFTKGQIRF